jgi:NMD protein affecting ribosome stability and mRNA decay
MPHYTENLCTRCGSITSPELLTIVRVCFYPRTKTTKVIKSRTIAWLCEGCLDSNEYWNLPSHKGAPGMTSQPLERVRRGEI